MERGEQFYGLEKDKTVYCRTCNSEMVRVDAQGRQDAAGGYLLCTLAQKEFAPSVFEEPWARRVHKRPELVPLPATNRRARARKKKLFAAQEEAFSPEETGQERAARLRGEGGGRKGRKAR